MDGHNLTKRIKEDKELQAIPVIIFSSLITEEMRRKGKEVGADEQLSKPEIGHLIGIVDHLWSAADGSGRQDRHEQQIYRSSAHQRPGK